MAAEAGAEGAPALWDALHTLLTDTARGGRPPTFTPEQITQLIALACTKPTDVGREGTHWTPRELADELQRQGVVDSISPRHVGGFLKGGRPEAAPAALLAQLRPRSRRVCRASRSRVSALSRRRHSLRSGHLRHLYR
ncbi:MAG: helix-turn-helix domain-containing protein [Armatimonadota bacterium]